jgi:voltage-gated potassium channel Kch
LRTQPHALDAFHLLCYPDLCLTRWTLFIFFVTLIFAFAYSKVGIDYGDYETAISPLYYSVVTLTTLGYGDVVPTSPAAQVLAALQALLGYVGLGGLLSILANKMARRAD